MLLASLLVIGAAAGYVGWFARDWRAVGVAAAGPQLAFIDHLDGANTVMRAALTDVHGPHSATSMHCLRYYSAGGTSVCMTVSGPGPTYSATVTDADGDTLREIPLPGIPSRARVSPSGRIVSWTSFVTGDSYSMPGGFSTRTGFLDLQTGTLVESLEVFRAEVDGAPLVAVDVNYWGLTTADDHSFLVTVASGGSTWLARGDLGEGVARSIRKGGECPSLSPDGSEVAYKRRVGRFGPWELDVLNLATGAVRSLPGTVGIDDQAEWLDADRIAYSGVSATTPKPGIFFVRSDGSSPAELTIPNSTSPSVVR